MARQLKQSVFAGGELYPAGTAEGDVKAKIADEFWTGDAGSGSSSSSYSGQSVEELQAEADKRGLTVEGSGKDGNVLKRDLVAAHEQDD
jgi:hypothetical protein